MKRNEWTVKFEAHKVQSAARRKQKHHEERREFWNVQLSEAESALKSKGAEVREYPITGGMQHQVVLDPVLSQRVAECKSKRDSHERDARAFSQWAVLCSQIAESNVPYVELDHEDVACFGLEEAIS